jgi:hypothetical protein
MKKGDTIIVIEGTIITAVTTEGYTSQGNPSMSASDDAAAECFGRARYTMS